MCIYSVYSLRAICAAWRHHLILLCNPMLYLILKRKNWIVMLYCSCLVVNPKWLFTNVSFTVAMSVKISVLIWHMCSWHGNSDKTEHSKSLVMLKKKNGLLISDKIWQKSAYHYSRRSSLLLAQNATVTTRFCQLQLLLHYANVSSISRLKTLFWLTL